MCDGCEVNQKYYAYATKTAKEDLLLESLCVPTQTEIREQLGSKLAEVFFEDLSCEGRVILGLVPPLSGPEDVWISPTSRLKNKVRCKPVPEPQVLHKKSFTHQMILDLGQQYVDVLNRKMQEEIEEALRRQALELEEECNKRLKEALEEANVKADEQCRQVVGTMMEHFDRCFTEMAETSKLRMRKECQLRVLDEKAELAAYMLTQVQDEVARRDLELCSDFHDTLYGELNALSRRFVKQIDMERAAAREILEDVVRKYETRLVDLRAEMEINSMVDICRALNEERAKFERSKKGSQVTEKERLETLVNWIATLKARNQTLQQMSTERAKRIKQYEKKMKSLIEEFQKFVNYALKASPAHAEFLLSTQKMILGDYFEDNLLHPEDYEEYKRCLLGKGSDVREVEPDAFPEEEKDVCLVEPEEPPEDPWEKCKREKDCPYTFNYYRFKYNVLRKMKGVRFDDDTKCRREKKPCPRPKEPPQQDEREEEEEEETAAEEEEETEAVLGQKSARELKETLTLVGETAKEHLQPISTFLRGRMKTIAQICRKDPELVKMMLGYPCEEVPGPGAQEPPRTPVRRCFPGPSTPTKPCETLHDPPCL